MYVAYFPFVWVNEYIILLTATTTKTKMRLIHWSFMQVQHSTSTLKLVILTQFLQIQNSNNILYPCLDHWCVHTGRDATFVGGAITCKVNAKTQTDAVMRLTRSRGSQSAVRISACRHWRWIGKPKQQPLAVSTQSSQLLISVQKLDTS